MMTYIESCIYLSKSFNVFIWPICDSILVKSHWINFAVKLNTAGSQLHSGGLWSGFVRWVEVNISYKFYKLFFTLNNLCWERSEGVTKHLVYIYVYTAASIKARL